MDLEKYTDEDIEFALQLITCPGQLDRAGVEAWLKDEAHRELVKELCVLREGGFSLEEQTDVEKEWRVFIGRHAMRRKRLPGYWISIAASVAAVLLVGFAWMYFYRSDSPGKAVKRTLAKGRVSEVTIVTDEGVREITAAGLLQLDENAREQNVFSDSIHGMSYLNVKADSGLQKRYHTLRVARGGEYFVQLADGTKVWLNAESELRYPVVFEKDSRRVELLKGEAYFEVSRDENRPFTVVTDKLVTRVLGTEFNVRDYPGKPLDVTLVRGSVSVKENRKGAEEVFLKPGENASWRETGTLVVEKVDVRSYVAWKDGFFFYNDARLEDMLDELGRWYDFSVFYENPSVKDMRFKFWVNREEPPEKLVERLRELGILEVRWNGKSLVVSVK